MDETELNNAEAEERKAFLVLKECERNLREAQEVYRECRSKLYNIRNSDLRGKIQQQG